MIKLNLLPKIADEKKVLRNTAIIFAVLLIAIIAGSLAYTMQLKKNIEEARVLEEEARIRKENVDRIKQDAQTWKDKLPPVKAKVDFFDSVMAYTDAYPKLYENIARWTYNKVQYNSISSPAPDTIVMAATAKTLDDVGRYLLNMYRATALFTEVGISGVPGYGQGQAGTVDFSVLNVIPQEAEEAEPVQESAPLRPSEMSGDALASSFPGRDVPATGGPNLASAPSAPVDTPAPAAPSLAGLEAIGSGVLRQPGAGVPKIINFTVTCKLKEPINVPVPPGTAAADPNAQM